MEQSQAAARAAFLRQRGPDGRMMPGPIGSTRGLVPYFYWCECEEPNLREVCDGCGRSWKQRGLPKLCAKDGVVYVEETMAIFDPTASFETIIQEHQSRGDLSLIHI